MAAAAIQLGLLHPPCGYDLLGPMAFAHQYGVAEGHGYAKREGRFRDPP
jgi:hypothetical protein